MPAFITWVTTYRYFAIFPLAIIEGPILMVACGFLLRLGYFDFLPLYLVLLIGDLIADMGWYWVGYFGARPLIYKYGKFFGLNPEIIQRTEELFLEYQERVILVSKLTMGFGFALATLVVAGISKMNLRKYMFFNTMGGMVWTLFLLGVGYFFGHLYLSIEKGFRTIFLIFIIVLVIGALYGMSKFMRETFRRKL